MNVGVVNKLRFIYTVELVWLGVELSFKYVCKVWPRELLQGSDIVYIISKVKNNLPILFVPIGIFLWA